MRVLFTRLMIACVYTFITYLINSPGQFNLEEGSTSCTECPAGRYKDYPGALNYSTTDHVTCPQCPINHYQNLTGQATCKLYVTQTVSCPVRAQPSVNISSRLRLVAWLRQLDL